ncbi:MAG: STAS domain-containing protein [Synergistaceae bacterium]|nr:STAS domain-containing protein [Synergistaceae bacterium]MBQ6970807.1 STAS domain-containing protein [Synergistaceae bacterium]
MASNNIATLKISKASSGSSLTISLEGRLDTTTAPQLEAEIKGGLDGVTELVFDMAGVEFVSSAGLRVFLLAQKAMKKQGSMKIRNLIPSVLNVFDVTGFSRILTIEK